MNIAVFLPNWIGDVVMATPVLRALKLHYPNAQVLAIGRSYVLPVVEGSPYLHRIIAWEKNGQSFFTVLNELKKIGVDLALLLPNSFRPALLARLAGCQRRIGFARYGRRFLLTDRLYPEKSKDGKWKPKPIIEDYIRLLNPLGIKHPGYQMEVFCTPSDEALAKKVFSKLGIDETQELIGLNPGAAFGAAKHWPIEHFAELAKLLIDHRHSQVLVLCGPNEKETARSIVKSTNRSSIFTLADESLSLGLTKACIQKMDLLVTTDSGPRHFAAAFDRPVISLFGPTHIEWTITYFPKEIYLQKKVPCGPCQQRTCHLDHRCMKELQPQAVFAQVSQLLKRYSRIGGIRHAG